MAKVTYISVTMVVEEDESTDELLFKVYKVRERETERELRCSVRFRMVMDAEGVTKLAEKLLTNVIYIRLYINNERVSKEEAERIKQKLFNDVVPWLSRYFYIISEKGPLGFLKELLEKLFTEGQLLDFTVKKFDYCRTWCSEWFELTVDIEPYTE